MPADKKKTARPTKTPRKAKEAESIRAEERLRLHRDLHDGLFQDVAAVVFLVQCLRRRLDKAKKKDEEAIKFTEQIWDAANRCVTRMHNVAASLTENRAS